jgi:SAM-dependent methyltransferase
MNYRLEQIRYDTFAKHLHPAGITHHMRPKSIETIMDTIGLNRIHNANVLEIGCGQGYLVNHFLYAGAKTVIGTDITQQIIDTIPLSAYEKYSSENKEVNFYVEDFGSIGRKRFATKYKNIEIISMFIGIELLVRKLSILFDEMDNVHTIVFMIPTSQFKDTKQLLFQYAKKQKWTIEEFTLHLSGSGEQRRGMVIKRTMKNTKN